MRRIYGCFKTLLLIAAFAAPLVCTGCAVRVHDRDDWHDGHEDRDHWRDRQDGYRDFYQPNLSTLRGH